MQNTQEEDRFVFGVFIVDEVYKGDGKIEGYVKSNSKYRIELSSAEAPKIKFWNYHANETNPEKAAWSQGLYRYASDAESVQILRDIVQIKQDPQEKKFAEEFLMHFCNINRINLNDIPEPNGALRR